MRWLLVLVPWLLSRIWRRLAGVLRVSNRYTPREPEPASAAELFFLVKTLRGDKQRLEARDQQHIEGWRRVRAALHGLPGADMVWLDEGVEELARAFRELASKVPPGAVPKGLPGPSVGSHMRGTAARPCESCGQDRQGATMIYGWYRCNVCGYPGDEPWQRSNPTSTT